MKTAESTFPESQTVLALTFVNILFNYFYVGSVRAITVIKGLLEQCNYVIVSTEVQSTEGYFPSLQCGRLCDHLAPKILHELYFKNLYSA